MHFTRTQFRLRNVNVLLQHSSSSFTRNWNFQNKLTASQLSYWCTVLPCMMIQVGFLLLHVVDDRGSKSGCSAENLTNSGTILVTDVSTVHCLWICTILVTTVWKILSIREWKLCRSEQLVNPLSSPKYLLLHF